MSSDEEPLMSAGRDVARVCTTQIDDASSRMIPSTVPATPATLARVVGECSPCPSDVIDALEDDLAPHRVAHVEVGHRDIPSLNPVDRCDVDRVVPCQSAVRWIDMTCGDDEEEVHQRPVEFEDDTIWMRGEERVVCQQRPSRRVVLGVETHNRFSPLQDTQLEGSRPEEVAMTECSDTESCESAGRPSRRLRLVWNESEAGPEVRNAATLIGVLATRVGAIPPWERFAWCNQEAALVCIERPSHLGCGQPRRVLPSVRVADFSDISSERTSAFLRRRNDSKWCGQDWLGGSPGSYAFLGREFRS